MPILRCRLLTLLFMVTSVFMTAQTVDFDFYDGQLWVQFTQRSTFEIAHQEGEVSVGDFAPLIGEQLMEEYGLYRIRKPFHFARNSEISEVYQFYFTAHDNAISFSRELSQLAVVNYAERVPIMRPTFTPNDLGPQSGTNNQWGLWRISAQDAWDITTATGSPIVVAIVDDAVLVTHPDLAPNLVAGFDVASNDADPMPNQAAMTHGTHVAGIAGASTNNGIGVASIGFNVKIMPIKASNSSQFISDAYAGVIWAADNGANVINMSWGGSGFSNTGQNIINYAYSAGCVNVAAAGNDNTSQIFYPAGYNNVISVASTTTNDAKSGFSNFGTWIDVSAPGSAIRSTYFNSSFQPTYANLQGTSMASPMVAGLAGLVWSVNPEMSQTQVTECIINTTDDISSANGSFLGQLGTGRINAFAAVQCALATSNAPPVAVVNSTSEVSCPGGLIQFLGGSAGGLATNYLWSFPGGNPGTSTLQNPVVSYSGVGFYDVSLTVSNDFGENTITMPSFIEVSSNGIDVFFTEDFEAETFSDTGWSIDNPDNGVTWNMFTVSGSVSGSRAAGINLFNYNSTGQRDRLITPPLDFSNHTNVVLDFQHAHRRSSQQFSDSLLIDVSTDGGANWERVLAAAETGQGTFATGTILNQNFIPTNGNDWCFGGDIGSGCFTVDLSDYDGASNVLIRFESYNDGGNNIYIDNVSISGNCLLVEAAPQAGLSIVNNTVCAGTPVQFLDQSVNVPTTYSWSFPGGNPATSNMPAPMVVYDTPGTYSVTLTVENSFGIDIVSVENIVTVTSAPQVELNLTEATLCVGSGLSLNATGADLYTWAPMSGLSSSIGASVTASPAQSQVYTVTGTSNGCTATAQIAIEVLEGPEAPEVVAEDQVAFVVLDPVEVQGHYFFAPPAAGWGSPALNTVSIEAELVIARDNAVGDSLLCNAAVNAAEISGKIAVIYRGGCEFSTKVLNAQNAGAVAVIVVNNTNTPPTIEMGPGVQGANVTIPVGMVTQETGNYLNAQINSGFTVARFGSFNGGSLTICPGETVQLAGPGGWDNYNWSNGAETATIEVNSGGTYTVSIIGENGCGTASSGVAVSVAAQATPVISQSGNTLFSGVAASTYQWFLNGQAIEGANSGSIVITEPGEYTVAVSNSIGCSAVSASFNATLVNVEEYRVAEMTLFPNPAHANVTIQSSFNTITDLIIYATDGRRVLQTGPLAAQERLVFDVSHLSSGIYHVVMHGIGAERAEARLSVIR